MTRDPRGEFFEDQVTCTHIPSHFCVYCQYRLSNTTTSQMFRFLCLTALAGAAFGQIPEVPKGDWRCVESKADTALAASGSVQVLYLIIVHCVSISVE